MYNARLWANGHGLVQMYCAGMILMRGLLNLLPFSHLALPLFGLQSKIFCMPVVPHFSITIIISLLCLS